jgi:fatty acid desaturase
MTNAERNEAKNKEDLGRGRPLMSWRLLRTVGNSRAAKLTVLIPLVGYATVPPAAYSGFIVPPAVAASVPYGFFRFRALACCFGLLGNRAFQRLTRSVPGLRARHLAPKSARVPLRR